LSFVNICLRNLNTKTNKNRKSIENEEDIEDIEEELLLIEDEDV